MKKVTLVLTEDEYKALLKGELKPREDLKIRVRRFKLSLFARDPAWQ